ncbi:ligase-associated DNA damage response endonuclease PdeM [Lacibacterium aquatile]|uniref:Ligase-associated DNA damage response endonuclease PdeM n=1 Tax=Lacibacterium aquatile TaxID=1168082 RepID=A0ABW5DST1_9PROT
MSCDFTLNGARLTALSEGGLWWAERRLLVVSDLHLEKATSLAARGAGLLPPYDSAETLNRLTRLAASLQPEAIIALGDSFHDNDGPNRLPESERAALTRLTAAHRWTWIIGNHDPAPDPTLGGEVLEEVILGPLCFRHEAVSGARGEVSGHFHPKAAVLVRGRRISGRCFIENGSRAILPAFGAYTGGLSVLDPAIGAHFGGRFNVHLIGKTRVVTIDKATLIS